MFKIYFHAREQYTTHLKLPWTDSLGQPIFTVHTIHFLDRKHPWILVTGCTTASSRCCGRSCARRVSSCFGGGEDGDVETRVSASHALQGCTGRCKMLKWHARKCVGEERSGGRRHHALLKPCECFLLPENAWLHASLERPWNSHTVAQGLALLPPVLGSLAVPGRAAGFWRDCGRVSLPLQGSTRPSEVGQALAHAKTVAPCPGDSERAAERTNKVCGDRDSDWCFAGEEKTLAERRDRDPGDSFLFRREGRAGF